MQRFAMLVAAVVLAVACGCAEKEENAPSASSVQSASGKPDVAVEPPQGKGAVVGRVEYTGDPPAPVRVRMNADPYCSRANEGREPLPPFRVDALGNLADVVVYVREGLEHYRYSPPAQPVVLDQQACRYVPEVVALQVGQPLEIRNSDETLHNVHAMPTVNSGFNIGMPRPGMTSLRKFSKPEVFVRIKCDVHPWMAAFVAVLANPYYAVTGEDGKFEIRGLPPGEYVIEAAHYALGKIAQRVKVRDDVPVSLKFRFSD